MQLKHPEILYFLVFLILPILVHLFQLQKFKKTPFTNVAFLQKLVLQTRKSSKLKKWLILASRLILLSAIIIAFSQPYISDKKTKEIHHNFIYLDNSLSLNSKGEKGDLLQNAIKEIIENASENETYSLLTNSDEHKNISFSDLKKLLLNLKNNSDSRPLDEVLLKIKSSSINRTNNSSSALLISDFQIIKALKKEAFTNVTSSVSFIQLATTQKNNVSIDSIFIQNQSNTNFLVHVVVKNQGTEKINIPIALYNKDAVFAKQTFSIKTNERKTIVFPIQNTQKINGKITIDFDDAFSFDNSFFFTLNQSKKINVFSIGNNHEFLSKIYNKNEFDFNISSIQNINYNALNKQELIILNELDRIPNTLITFLQKHLNENKSVVIIPSQKANTNSYNSFFNTLNLGRIQNLKKDSLKIANINFKSPFFKNVFSKEVRNFQYPTVKNYYPSNFTKSSSLIKFDNQQQFFSQIQLQKGIIYWSSSSLNTQNSNFTNSPLVVPLFYNFGKLSAKYPKPYYTIGKTNFIDIATSLTKNQVLSIQDNTNSFIPLQQSYPSKVTLQTKEKPNKQGLYTVKIENTSIKNLAYNNNSLESELQFLNIKELITNNKNLRYSESVTDVFQTNQEKNKVTWFWKWFLALAIVSLFFEILILKFFKP